jgi:hypothetical protein
MGMNLYLIYLATILSASGFNTYNYISNRVRQIKIKKRQMKFKKNLSFKTKTVSSIGDTVPSIVYFGSTLLSLIPIVNLCIPEFSKNLYNGLGVDDALDGFYRMLNEAETTKRAKAKKAANKAILNAGMAEKATQKSEFKSFVNRVSKKSRK